MITIVLCFTSTQEWYLQFYILFIIPKQFLYKSKIGRFNKQIHSSENCSFTQNSQLTSRAIYKKLSMSFCLFVGLFENTFLWMKNWSNNLVNSRTPPQTILTQFQGRMLLKLELSRTMSEGFISLWENRQIVRLCICSKLNVGCCCFLACALL